MGEKSGETKRKVTCGDGKTARKTADDRFHITEVVISGTEWGVEFGPIFRGFSLEGQGSGEGSPVLEALAEKQPQVLRLP